MRTQSALSGPSLRAIKRRRISRDSVCIGTYGYEEFSPSMFANTFKPLQSLLSAMEYPFNRQKPESRLSHWYAKQVDVP